MAAKTPSSRHFVLAATFTWIALLVLSFLLLTRYSLTAGERGEPPVAWPAQTHLPRSAGTHTLILTVHPRCPCSRATITQLAEIMARCSGRLTAHVLFVLPTGYEDAWAETDLWRAARLIPGVRVLIDGSGKEARRFRSFTSGQATVYDPEGRLVFNGGITGARGHVGANPGQQGIVGVVLDDRFAVHESAVYGCPLEDRATHEQQGGHRCRTR